MRRVALACALAVAVSAPGAGAASPRVRVSPAVREVTVRPGQQVWVPFVAEGPAVAREPLDVLILVDTSAWATPGVFEVTRDALVLGVRRLAASRPHSRFAVAEYRDLGDADARGQATYRLLRGLGPADDHLSDVLRSLRPGLADHPHGSAATVALDEAVFGDGHLGVVPPGGQVAFRGSGGDAVVLLVTDSPVAQGEVDGTELYPDIDETGQQARRVGDVVALVPTAGPAPARVRGDLERLTLFHRRSWRDLDCASSRDVREASPLVCAPLVDPAAPGASRDRIAALVPALVDSVGALTYAWTSTPPGFEPKGHDIHLHTEGVGWLDPARAFRLPFRVRVSCPRERRGRTVTVPVHVTHDRVVARDVAALRVRCVS